MTLTQYLGKSASDWEMLSEQELQTLCEPYFKVTRPTKERAVEAKKAASKKTMGQGELANLMADVQRLMAQAHGKTNNPN